MWLYVSNACIWLNSTPWNCQCKSLPLISLDAWQSTWCFQSHEQTPILILACVFIRWAVPCFHVVPKMAVLSPPWCLSHAMHFSLCVCPYSIYALSSGMQPDIIFTLIVMSWGVVCMVHSMYEWFSHDIKRMYVRFWHPIMVSFYAPLMLWSSFLSRRLETD